MALIITLILLSVITFLTIAFLAVTQRERGTVTVQSHQADAKLGADAALERAKIQILAPMIALTNPFKLSLLVSANYINPLGFSQNPPALTNPTNVNYEHVAGSLNTPLSLTEAQQNLANLLYDPRPPVFVRTNRNQNPPEFRYFLNLNRNVDPTTGTNIFDPTGLAAVRNDKGGYYDLAGNEIAAPVPGNTLSNWVIGDPQWIGLLERPDQPHSPSNRFVSRIAYFVVPSSLALDINHVHNQAKRLGSTADGFWRNQGAGTWELNFAAFLADLNTNLWASSTSPYNYTIGASSSGGFSFEDARQLLRYRYSLNGDSTSGDYNNLARASQLFGPRAGVVFPSDRVDAYTDGPLDLGPALSTDNDAVNNPWPGAENPSHFFNAQDVFDPVKSSSTFVSRLQGGALTALQLQSTYNSSMYYRMMEQLGTDSAPERNRINVNYVNVDTAGNVLPDYQTNLIAWRPLQFFTNAAERLLRSTTTRWLAEDSVNFTNRFGTNRLDGKLAFGVSGIPIFDTNNANVTYSATVHRLLQVAANLQGATTPNGNPALRHLPSVYRPLFRSTNGGDQVFIVGFAEVTDTSVLNTNVYPLRDLASKSDRAILGLSPNDLVKGIPLVVEAKKGLPNFNELAAENIVQATRILTFGADPSTGLPNQTNQIQSLAISTVFGSELWNPYSSNFTRQLSVNVQNDVTMILTNANGIVIAATNVSFTTNYLVTSPWAAKTMSLPFNDGIFVPLFSNVYSNINQFPILLQGPRLLVRHHLRSAMVDTAAARLVDYVDLAGPEMEFFVDVTNVLVGEFVDGRPSALGKMWSPARKGGTAGIQVPTEGVLAQIFASFDNSLTDNLTVDEWANFNATVKDRVSGAAGFRAFMAGKLKTNFWQAPFNPVRKFYHRISWQANDPMVHYLASDLTDLNRTNEIGYLEATNRYKPLVQNAVNGLPGGLRAVNKRYAPWESENVDVGLKTDLRFKDPLIRSPDNWDFPTNKLPSVGLIGRIHRGTPWQTIYLKSPRIDNVKADENAPLDTQRWQIWTGNPNYYDATNSRPETDWALFDVLSAAMSDDATRGQLSVNQTNLAAWSAVLSGVITLTNTTDVAANSTQPTTQTVTVQPAGVYDPKNTNTWPAVVRIVNGINRTRADVTQFPKQVFEHTGDLLAVPELTVKSPFLDLTGDQAIQGISDATYERLPQQIMGLVRGGDQPRFVVYAYGQSLRPAENSVLSSGPLRGLCTNYQIMAEQAIRAVVQVQGAPTNTSIVVESYNLLPPD